MAADLPGLDFCYLTTTGRITGTAHRIEIWFALHEQTVYLMAGDRDRSDWVRNILASPQVILEIGDKRVVTTARIVRPDEPADDLARKLLVAKYGARPGSGDLTSWGRSALPVAIDWTGDDDGPRSAD